MLQLTEWQINVIHAVEEDVGMVRYVSFLKLALTASQVYKRMIDFID